MFEDHSSADIQHSEPVSSKFPRKILVLLGAVIVIIAVVGFGIWRFISSRNLAGQKTKIQIESTSTNLNQASSSLSQLATSSTSSLPVSNEGDFLVEYTAFSNFYKEAPDNFQAKINDYTLPINVKVQAANYYDTSRKLDIDNQIGNLNKLGFAIIDNPNTANPGDFYSTYTWLYQKRLPLLITSDFLVYYYQNSAKRSFKDIEETLFYNNLWKINKDLFETARKRYENRLAIIGEINDPVLEGERLEAAFFAVGLELLNPSPKQIGDAKNPNDKNKFLPQDAEKFNFVLPDYLKEDVDKEVALIRENKKIQKSPVMLYQHDYRRFVVPDEYKNNARLSNFYLATAWFNSVFPLYTHGTECPDCPLDKNDWRVNFTAAAFIARDFSVSYDLKNQWARVYKTISFFKGLRDDLTYIDYRDALDQVLGPDYDLEKELDINNPQANQNIDKVRSLILARNFNAVKGAFNRDNLADRPNLGLKMLADFYWPNDYLFGELSGDKVGAYEGRERSPLTFCGRDGVTSRCRGMALDIINLIFPAPDPLWLINTNYHNFAKQFNNLKATISAFSDWQANSYWSTIKLVKSYLENRRENQPNFGRSDEWQKREVSSAAAYWLNLQLPLDYLGPRQDSKQSLENDAQGGGHYFVEPNIRLIDELIADNEMLIGMMSALQIDQEVDSAYSRLLVSLNNLKRFRAIAVNELNSGIISEEDNLFIEDFVREFQNNSTGNKKITLSKGLSYNLEKLKLLLIVHNTDGQPAFAVGPIFSYTEER